MNNTVTEWSDAIMTSLSQAMAMLFSAIPKILGFVVILLVGWLLASLVERGVAALLRTIRFNDLSERSGFADFVRKMGADADSSGMIGSITKWFIRLIALVVAFDALGLPAVSDVLRQLLLWLPNVVVALVVLVIGGLAARALGNLVRGAAAEGGLGNPQFLSKVASTLVWAFAIVVAVNQIGIATELVNTLFMAVVGAVALALALAFGLGGRETASRIVQRWYGQGELNAEAFSRTAEAASNRVNSGMTAGGAPGGAGSTLGGRGGAAGGFQPSPASRERPQ
ncbi:MAG: mechanosensitive ion channel family protein [Ramlibacter sp.]